MNDQEKIDVKEYFDRILEEREKALGMAMKVIDQRLDSLNHLRSEMMQERTSYLNRDVFENVHSDLIRRVDAIENSFSRMIGIAITLIALAGLFGFMLSKILK